MGPSLMPQFYGNDLLSDALDSYKDCRNRSIRLLRRALTNQSDKLYDLQNEIRSIHINIYRCERRLFEIADNSDGWVKYPRPDDSVLLPAPDPVSDDEYFTRLTESFGEKEAKRMMDEMKMP
jgi:hypothetical protein